MERIRVTKPDDSAFEEFFKSVEEYQKAYPGWKPVEKGEDEELTMDLIKDAGETGLYMGKGEGEDAEPEGYVLRVVKGGGRRKKTRKGRRKSRKGRKSRRVGK